MSSVDPHDHTGLNASHTFEPHPIYSCMPIQLIEKNSFATNHFQCFLKHYYLHRITFEKVCIKQKKLFDIAAADKRSKLTNISIVILRDFPQAHTKFSIITTAFLARQLIGPIYLGSLVKPQLRERALRLILPTHRWVVKWYMISGVPQSSTPNQEPPIGLNNRTT